MWVGWESEIRKSTVYRIVNETKINPSKLSQIFLEFDKLYKKKFPFQHIAQPATKQNKI
jgi:hypothetical protein